MNGPKLTVILAEDDDGHASLIRRNLERAQFDSNLIRVRDGLALLDLLDCEIEASLAGFPLMILLDISMPNVNGIEALRRIKSDPRTRTVPVFMLTTTDNPIEVARCYAAGCNAYVTKPVSYQAFTAAMERLCGFLGICQVPPHLPGAGNACV
jgi:CheY-like chemotaxis protein